MRLLQSPGAERARVQSCPGKDIPGITFITGSTGTGSPIRFKPSRAILLRATNSTRLASQEASASGVKQASAAICVGAEAHRKKLTARLSAAASSSSGSTNHPRRQPVMPKYFEKLETIMTSRSVSNAVRAGRPPALGSASDR